MRESPTRAMSTSWVSSARAVGKSHAVHISNPRAGSTPGTDVELSFSSAGDAYCHL